MLIFILFIYTMYSVKKYFGFMRATGIDHFDPSYKDKPFEKRGIFKWSSNAMYTFAIAIFFGFAIFCRIKSNVCICCLYLYWRVVTLFFVRREKILKLYMETINEIRIHWNWKNCFVRNYRGL